MLLAPRVSVVMPAYNAAQTITASVKSVQAQHEFTDLEIVVVDDGSTDDTFKRVEALAKHDSRINLHRIEHAGVAAARNAAIKRATGAFIATLDADDIYLPHKLLSQWRLMQEDKEAVACYGGYRKIDARDKLLRLSARECFAYEGNIAHRIISKIGAPALTMFIRKSSIDRIKLPEDDSSGLEDRELFLRIALQGPIRYIPQVLGYYRKGHSSTNVSSQANAATFVQRSIQAINRHAPEMEKIASQIGQDRVVIDPSSPAYKKPSIFYKIRFADSLPCEFKDPELFSRHLKAEVYRKAAHQAERELNFSDVGKYARLAVSLEPRWWQRFKDRVRFNTNPPDINSDEH